MLVTRIMRGAYAWRIVRPGDLIVSVNGKSVKTLEQLDKALAEDEATWAIELDRNGRRISGTVRL